MSALEITDAVVQERFSEHPFSYGISRQNAGGILANYLAMTQAFPYLQAGSQANLIMQAIERNVAVPLEVEMTSVVGNFLSWDETGGHHLLLENGIEALPSILDTQGNFQSHHLKRDIAGLLGREVVPSYSDITKRYLKNLFDGLSSLEHLRRVAYMVAFERHAGQMMDTLWNSLAAVFEVDRDGLVYFRLHVGGFDPAEIYRIGMTRSLAGRLVDSAAELDRFVDHFLGAYAENFNWCDAIKRCDEPVAGTGNGAGGWTADAPHPSVGSGSLRVGFD